MKILEPLKINISAAKAQFGEEISVNEIKSDLELEGAVVRGYTDGSSIVMEISGDITLDQIELVFEDAGMPGIVEFVIDDMDDADEFAENEELDVVETFESKKVRFSKSLIESVRSKNAPKKAVVKNKMVNLSEALGFTKKVENKLTLDEVIDSMVGTRITESIATKAIQKAKDEKLNAIKKFEEKLGTKRCFRIMESLEAHCPFMYPDVKINGVRMAEYSINQLKALEEKLNVQISELERKISLNEGDTAILEKELASKKKLQTMLEDEMTYRLAFDHKVNEDDEKHEFTDLKSTEDAAESKEAEEKDAEDEAEKSENVAEETEEKEVNPDKDEETEVSNIVITLANKDAAEELKRDLVDAGIPEDVVIIEMIEEETEDVEETEEKTEEESDEEKTEESVSVNGSKLNEDDEAEEKSEEDAEPAEEEKSEDEESDDEEKDEAVKLILKDTDYVETLVNVLEDTWGLSHEEFEEMIGGEIVAETEDEEESDEDSEDDDYTSADDEEFNPDEIFKDL